MSNRGIGEHQRSDHHDRRKGIRHDPRESPLADVFALYLKTKDWHMSGPHFRYYHLMLDEQSDQIFAMTDVLAEQVHGSATLRYIPSGRCRDQRIADKGAPYVVPRHAGRVRFRPPHIESAAGFLPLDGSGVGERARCGRVVPMLDRSLGHVDRGLDRMRRRGVRSRAHRPAPYGPVPAISVGQLLRDHLVAFAVARGGGREQCFVHFGPSERHAGSTSSTWAAALTYRRDVTGVLHIEMN